MKSRVPATPLANSFGVLSPMSCEDGAHYIPAAKPPRSPRLYRRSEPVGVQAFHPQGLIEGFDVSVVGRFSRPAKVDFDPVLIRPQVHDLTAELGSVVAEKHLRCSPLGTNLIEHLALKGRTPAERVVQLAPSPPTVWNLS
jgi:hypothetical protein